MRCLHQVLIGYAPGDAISDQARLIRCWLRATGLESEIYAEHIHPQYADDARLYTAYRPLPGDTLVIFHHSIGSPVVDYICALPVKLLVIYHNVTPPEFFDPGSLLSRQMVLGREQLFQLRSRTILAVADSAYNELDLKAADYAATRVLPIILDPARYDFPLTASLQAQGPSLLFVGRLVPNKKQEDVIKLLYFYRRIEPNARLLVVGDPWFPAYADWLKELTRHLNLTEAVLFVGHTSQAELVNYYRLASVYVSMSEHEGFGKPLIESMYLGLPVLAYAAAAVPGTLGEAGVLFRYKHYEALAEVVDILVRDQALRARILAQQEKRVQAFMETNVRQLWHKLLEELI